MTQHDAYQPPSAEVWEYPPLLNVIVPAMILVVSGAYAWSLRTIVNPEMNLLLLKPLFLVIWVLLVVVVIVDTIPSIRRHRAWLQATARQSPGHWHETFGPRSEATAGLVVVATLAFSFFGPGRGAAYYLASLFVYLCVAGYLIGDRKLPRLIIGSALCSAGLYVVMGLLLGVRL